MIDLPMIIAAFLIGWPGVAQAVAVDVALWFAQVIPLLAVLVSLVGFLRRVCP